MREFEGAALRFVSGAQKMLSARVKQQGLVTDFERNFVKVTDIALFHCG